MRLPHGASIGDNYGPIVVSSEVRDASEIGSMRIAVPGELTSAYSRCIFNRDFEHVVVPFDQIIDAVRDGEADAGLLIHEGQLFTAKWGFIRSSISVNGGTRRQSCRCRWVEMPFDATWART